MAEKNIYSELGRTIDLRRPQTQTRTPANPTHVKRQVFEWSALEFEEHQRGPYWFIFMAVAALALIIFGVFTRSYFFIAFVALAFAVLTVYARRAPREIAFTINAGGVGMGRTFLPFSELKTFWIFDEGERKELSLETKKMLTPFMRLPLGEENPEDIRSILADFLPEEEHKELATDKIARSLGL